MVTVLALAGSAEAQPAPAPLPVLDVPFISQSEALCGGAAAAMVLRYWGARGLTAESFAHLVDRSAAGIRTNALVADLQERGWQAIAVAGTVDLIASELARGRPVLTLIEDRPGTFHYIVIVSSTPRAIVFHDPARAPFRVMVRDEFTRRWERAGDWMAVVTPGTDVNAGARDPSREAVGVTSPAPDAGLDDPRAEVALVARSCDELVAEGVRLAQEHDMAAAERTLGAALSCPGPAPLRELAGVRVLQKRWGDAEELAAAAVAEDPRDAHAWRLLATSRFLQNERMEALDAWNRVDEPRVDIVAVSGLTRTRQRVVERLMRIDPGDTLTVDRFAIAARRLASLPSATASRLEYVPVPLGRAELRATVVERPVIASGWLSYAATGLKAAARRELEVTLGALSGGGERLSAAWRFWPGRPRIGASMEAPAPWGGVWGLDASAERQPFTGGVLAPAERATARVTASSWLTSHTNMSGHVGVDRWRNSGSFARVGTAVVFATIDHRLTAHVGVSAWAGPRAFGAIDAGFTARSSAEQRGWVHIGRVDVGTMTAAAPADTWFAGDTGHVRPTLLRAHPLLDEGALRVDRLGRQIVHGSAEAQHWWRAAGAVGVAGAAFIDAARIDRRAIPGTRGDLDVGLGARMAIPGISGTFRVDVARALRDGATAVSFAYDP